MSAPVSIPGTLFPQLSWAVHDAELAG